MRRASIVLLAIVALGCRRKATPQYAGSDAGTTTAPAPLPPSAKEEVALDMLEDSPRCRIEHRGVLVDLGAPEAAWSTPGRPDAATDLPSFERDGTTWGRVLDRSQSFTVALDASGPAVISLRGRARGAKKAVASVDGKAIGNILLAAGEDKVVTVTNAAVTLSAGIHVVSLRWIGAVKKDEPLAELDWIRLGVSDGDTSTYAAPTRRDAVNQIAIGGAPRKAYTLMAPAVIRCVAWIPPGAVLAADIGAIGEGTGGEVELRERETGSDLPKTLGKHAAGANAWSGVTAKLSIGGANGGIGVVEIAVTKAPKQGRVAIAEPRILRASPTLRDAPKAPTPRAVVVVAMAGLTSAHAMLPSLQKLAREGVSFRAHRAPSPLAPASVASLVTGLPVPVHALEDGGARLSPRTTLLGKMLQPFGVESAMFTEAPTTGPAFGFAHDWTHYAARSPLDGGPAAFDEIGKFLQANAGKKIVIVAHARGAHPPWDVSAEALKGLPPEGYTGLVDPKHVINILTKARRGLLKLNDQDRVRLAALAELAITAQDRRLDQLIEDLRTAGTLDQTMLVVTGDAPYVIPSGEGKASAKDKEKEKDAPPPPEPTEEPLAIPLVIRFAGGHASGKVVTAITDPTDVAATIVAAYGGSIVDLEGRDLARLALDDEPARDTARLSDDGRGYQLAWGDLRLVGSWGKVPALRLKLGGDDLRAKRPYEYLAAWGLAATARDRWLSSRSKGPGREPATIDGATSAALDTWERAR